MGSNYSSDTPKGMKCPVCGVYVDEKDDFCANCGAKLKENNTNNTKNGNNSRNTMLGVFVAVILVLIIAVAFVFFQMIREKNTSDVATQQITQPTEPVTQPTTQPTEPVTQPMTQPTELVTQPTAQPTEPVTQPTVQPTEPVTQPMTQPTLPVTQPTTQPTIHSHTPVSIGEARTATCTESGFTSGIKCSECGEIIEQQVILPKKEHEWQSATCTVPETCAKCGETKGSVLAHELHPATCTAPAICVKCGEMDGTALGHDWLSATCTAPETCLNCGETRGTVIEHKWLPATNSSPKHCESCGLTEGNRIYVPGDIIRMGTYEQNGYAGDGREEIEWMVLRYSAAEEKALVISKYCLDTLAFDYNNGTWENSSIREWLNGYFIADSFTLEERSKLLTATIVTGSVTTTDTVFLLDLQEASTYFPSNEARQGTPTEYCKQKGCYDPVAYARKNGTELNPDDIGHTWWYLRSEGIDKTRASNVISRGTVSSYGGEKNHNQGTIRPAMWIKTS